MRVARPSSDPAKVTHFYVEEVGLTRLGGFADHNGYDGAFVGKAGADWHIEFTRQESGEPHPSPTDEDLLVVYLAADDLAVRCAHMDARGHARATHPNPYWATAGAVAYRDPDGYFVVLCPGD